MKKKKKILIALVGALLFLGVQSVKAQDVSSWSELKDAIQKGTTPINLTTDITNYTSEGLGTFGSSLVTINGNRHNINGNDYKGITVAEGQTLNIDNAGNPANENAKGFNGFNNGIRNLSLGGGVILNHGTTTITGSSFTGNNSDFFGAAIYNDATATITGSTFIDNNSKFFGGAIYNEGTATITNTTFSSNHISEGNGGAICNDARATITGSTFTGNNSDFFSGAIYNKL